MKTKELQSRTEQELRTLVEDLRKRVRSLEFELAAGKIKNVQVLRGAKKDIARILTLLTARHHHG